MIGKERKKRFATKVRTGCITCRRRHVKCDELKPSCRKCTKFEVDCEGYGKVKVPPLGQNPLSMASDGVSLDDSPSHRFKKLNKLAPKTVTVAKLARQPSHQIPQLRLQRRPQTAATIRHPPLLWVNDERDGRYLRQFKEETASHLAGYFRDPILREGIIQACCLSPHIRNAAIGLAALDRASREVRGSHNALKHYEVATTRFIDSIRGMRQSVESPEPLQDPRLFLVFCLLAFCFEAWNGSSSSAVSQVRSGWHRVQSWLDTRNSHPDATDCELTQLFNRLDNSTVVSPGTERGLSREFFRPRWMITIDDEMPAVFDTVEDARMWHEVLVQSLLHSVLESHKIKLANTSLVKKQGTSHAAAAAHLINFMTNARQSLVAKFEQWHQAFKPLLQHAYGSPAYAATISLELRYRASSKPLAGTLGLGEVAFDDYYDDFALAVRLASVLIAHERRYYRESKGIATFTIDGSIVPSLYVVGVKCRDRQIRRQAVQILVDNPRREGLWDSGLVARIAMLSISIEEEDAPGDVIIPESARITGVRAFSSMLERSGTMSYTKTTMDDDMKPAIVARSIEFCW